MSQSTVFTNNRSQAVRLPADTRFPDSVKKVDVRVVGVARVITPVDAAWDSFFIDGPGCSDDFMQERAGRTKASATPSTAETRMLAYLLDTDTDTDIAIYVIKRRPLRH